MNRAEVVAEVQRGKRVLVECEATLADLLLEDMSTCDRIEQDALPEDGVATSAEIYDGLRLYGLYL
jgi:hypothetical protein